MQNVVEVGARFAQELQELGQLRQECHAREDEHKQRVDKSFGNHRAERFGERYAVTLFERAATGYFAHTRNDQAGSVGHENGVGA